MHMPTEAAQFSSRGQLLGSSVGRGTDVTVATPDDVELGCMMAICRRIYTREMAPLSSHAGQEACERKCASRSRSPKGALLTACSSEGNRCVIWRFVKCCSIRRHSVLACTSEDRHRVGGVFADFYAGDLNSRPASTPAVGSMSSYFCRARVHENSPRRAFIKAGDGELSEKI